MKPLNVASNALMLVVALAAISAQAATTGKLSLYVRDDFTDHTNFIEVTEKDGQKVTGRSTFGGGFDDIVRLEKDGTEWTGRANGQSWSASYANGRVTGAGRSNLDVAFAADGSFAGTVNVGVPQALRGTLTADVIEVIAPFGGTIKLTQTREGRYSARGQLARGRATFRGDLKVEGSFMQMDPSLLVILLGGAFIQR